MASEQLQKELKYFKDNQDKLVADHSSKFLIIKDQRLYGAYNTQIEAYNDAKMKFELGTFLIQHCLPGNQSYTQTFYSRVSH
jgi:hypothetical protein